MQSSIAPFSHNPRGHETMLRHVLTAGGRATMAATRPQSRNMGMGPKWLTKNKYVEEWNGRREITELGFEATSANVFNIVIFGVVVPLGVYWLARSELQKNGDRRYKDIC